MKHKGFTLIELLVVISIIALMAGAMGVALRDGGSAATLGNSQRALGGMFQSARSIAVLKQTDAAVIIYRGATSTADADPDRSLRYAEVVFYNKERGRWESTGQGTYLPQGTYYIPPSSAPPQGGITVSDNQYENEDLSTLGTSSSGVTSTEVPGSTWYVYEFDSSGFFKGNSARVLIGLGRTVAPDTVAFDNPAIGRGFYVRKLGSVTYFNDIQDSRP